MKAISIWSGNFFLMNISMYYTVDSGSWTPTMIFSSTKMTSHDMKATLYHEKQLTEYLIKFLENSKVL